jgi:hypothetical protein
MFWLSVLLRVLCCFTWKTSLIKNFDLQKTIVDENACINPCRAVITMVKVTANWASDFAPD